MQNKPSRRRRRRRWNGVLLTSASGKSNIGYVLGLSVRRVSGDNQMNFPKLVGRQESKSRMEIRSR
jgi:hypothetical protein